MQYEEFEEEQAKSENLSITQRLDGLKLSKWHKFIIICLGF